MKKLTPTDQKIVDDFRTYAKRGEITWDAYRDVAEAFSEESPGERSSTDDEVED